MYNFVLNLKMEDEQMKEAVIIWAKNWTQQY